MKSPPLPHPDLPYGSIAKGYDRGMRFFEQHLFGWRRAELIPKATGDVLELGAGTGVNLMLYTSARSLVLTDPDPLMLEKARTKPRLPGLEVQFIQAGAEHLPFPDQSFDTVVATLVFCSIPRPTVALAEIRRILKPGGKLLMLEHIRPSPLLLGFVTDCLTPLQKRLCGGCHLNRRTVSTVQAQGFSIQHVNFSKFDVVATLEATLSYPSSSPSAHWKT
ncbi:MAG TPA: class I SAM-dependent methyltransferase [Acidobacteriota bacterium]|nr:class I SAM-dependent methyltransferase [Acidobacteriota bacterium]HND18086.1 class I SAM-dependent methyltransferase [Acidobacteriota bacterium]HNH81324.1 class I SAM-dependent methyltransferase [Acidobacteriota bacterium]